MALGIAYVVVYITASVEWFVKHDIYTAVSFAVVIPLVLLIPRLLYRLGTVKLSWRAYVERLGLYIVLLNAIGTGYFHTTAPQYQYDRLLHFSASFWGVPLIILLMMAFWGKLPNVRTTIVFACLTMLVGIFLWEGWQYFSDHVFRSRSFYDARQAINRDFMEDVIFGILGIFASIPYVRSMMPTYRSYLRS